METEEADLPRLKLDYRRVEADWNGKAVRLLVAISADAEICPFFVPDSRLARRAEALWIIRKDLHLTSEYCSLLIEHLAAQEQPRSICQALWQSAVMTYARCFVSASEGRVRLEEDILKDADLALQQAHARTIELRHKYFAHSTGKSHFDLPAGEYENVREIVSLHVALDPDENRRRIVEFYYDIAQAAAPRIDQIIEMRRLILYVKAETIKKLKRAESALLRELETTFPIDHWYEGAVRQVGEN